MAAPSIVVGEVTGGDGITGGGGTTTTVLRAVAMAVSWSAVRVLNPLIEETLVRAAVIWAAVRPALTEVARGRWQPAQRAS